METTHDAKVKDVFFVRTGRSNPEEGTRLSDNPKRFALGDWVTSKYGDKGSLIGKVVEVADDYSELFIAWAAVNHYDHTRDGVERFDIRRAESWLLHIHVSDHQFKLWNANLGNNITALLLKAGRRWDFVGHTAGAPFKRDNLVDDAPEDVGAYDGHVRLHPIKGGKTDYLTQLDVWHDYTGRITVARLIGEKYVGQPYATVVNSHGGGDAGHAALMWLIG